MARIRSVKPEVRTSLVVAAWPRDVRLLWLYLWCYLDDHGRGVDDARLVKAECFPLDDDITGQVVDEWLDLIASSGPLCRYQIGNRRLMHAVSWGEHQRPQHPTRSRIDLCPVHEASNVVQKNSGGGTETLIPEQGNKGTREQGRDTRVVVAEQLPPPRTCSRHPNGTTRRCGACGDARTRSDAWLAERAAQARASPRCPTHPTEPAATCGMCRGERIGVDPPPTVVDFRAPRRHTSGRHPPPDLSQSADA